ncbi:helix-turn-helix domain-containing protein [Schleiferilactobacillus harbinensis]|uniref:helix-turn-helix domain-containing protein n=1 Tax=Schleiferilactobacillus harbinensis TaxID=304207 RepID=UPI00345E7C98
MTSNIGKVFREIRLSRHLSLDYVSCSIVTKSFLSKFERGQSSIMFEKLVALLERMQVTITEFMYRVHHYFWTPTQHFFVALKQAQSEGNTGDIESLIVEEANQVAQPLSIHDPHYLRKIAAECSLAALNDTKPAQNDVDSALDHLLQTEDWMQADLNLFLFLIPFCGVETLVEYSTEIAKKSVVYLTSDENGQTVVNIQLNILAMLLYNNALSSAGTLIGLLSQNATMTMYAAENLFIFKHLQIVYHHLLADHYDSQGAYKELLAVMKFLDTGKIRTDVEQQHQSFHDNELL